MPLNSSAKWLSCSGSALGGGGSVDCFGLDGEAGRGWLSVNGLDGETGGGWLSIDGLDGEAGACGDGLSTDKLDKSVSVNSPPFDELVDVWSESDELDRSVSVNSPPFDELADVWSDELGESLPRKEKSDREGGK